MPTALMALCSIVDVFRFVVAVCFPTFVPGPINTIDGVFYYYYVGVVLSDDFVPACVFITAVLFSQE